MELGAYTMYNDFVNDPQAFEKNNVPCHYPINGDRLVIGKFCSIACGAKFIFQFKLILIFTAIIAAIGIYVVVREKIDLREQPLARIRNGFGEPRRRICRGRAAIRWSIATMRMYSTLGIANVSITNDEEGKPKLLEGGALFYAFSRFLYP